MAFPIRHRFLLWHGLLAALLVAAVPCLALASNQLVLAPPPEPTVHPLIAHHYPEDADHNRIADSLDSRIVAAASQTPSPLNEMASVELVFSAQITRAQIDAFQALGGQIDYIYRSVSYGWNGRIPLGQVASLPAALGANLVLVAEPKRVVPTLDIATQSGRVRPVWAAGFAGQPAGFDGDPNITIAVIDTGVDGTHTDLAGRQQFWKDYTSDAFASPRDLRQHGTHVASIALGTGAAGGTSGTLFYTQIGSMLDVINGRPVVSSIGLPGVPLTVNATAQWINTDGPIANFGLSYQPAGTVGSFTWVDPGPSIFRSPLNWTGTFTPSTSNVYSASLLSNGHMSDYVITTSVTNYPGTTDGFNRFRGVAPACMWAGAKVFTDAGEGFTDIIGGAVDELVARRVTDNIKVMNLSLGVVGDPGIDTVFRQKVNTAVNNGIVVCTGAGNNASQGVGAGNIDDPGRAGLALTVGAANDVNCLTDYTSLGFSGSFIDTGEDAKPDLMAPGGSSYYTGIMAADSNTGDTPSFTDQRPNDYYNLQGTSMSSPFAAGCAALVIDALQQRGVTWDFTSAQHAAYVKMVLCATATESNANREGNNFNPTLERAGIGPIGFPAGKDPFEGFGMINADAAVEAVYLTYAPGAVESAVLGADFNDRRAWARNVSLAAGAVFAPTLTVPGTGDFDLYLYGATPSNTGTPVLLAASTAVGNGVAESLLYTSPAAGSVILVVKRVSGSGAFTLTTVNRLGDYNQDGHVDGDDLPHFIACELGPSVAQPDANCADADFDHDGDVDQTDFSIWQRCYTGPNAPIDPHCAG